MSAFLSKLPDYPQSARYYILSQASYRPADEYYIAGKEPDGLWYNPHGMFGLKDGDNVLAEAFFTLYGGFHPRNPPLDFRPRLTPKLTRNTGHAGRTAAFDLIFSADKPTSLAWKMARDEQRLLIAQAHDDAVRSALDLIVKDHCSWTRHRPDRSPRMKTIAAKIMGATFRHQTSLAGDPDLHTHAVIFNFTQTRQGTFRALYARPLHAWTRAAGAVYRNALAYQLRSHPQLLVQSHEQRGSQLAPADTPLCATEPAIDDIIDTVCLRLSRIGFSWNYTRLIAEIMDCTAGSLSPGTSMDLAETILSDPRIAELDRQDGSADDRMHLPHYRRYACVT